MSVQTADATIDLEPDTPAEPGRWNPVTRVAFRFSFVYFGLFLLIYPQPILALFGPLTNSIPEKWGRAYAEFPSPLVEWVGRTVFDVEAVLRTDSGSGDQTYLWVLVFCFFAAAVVATIVWSVLDRKRLEYRRLAGWFFLFVRILVAGQMLLYGFAKAIPAQMPEPSLITLLSPFGDFTLISVLWTQVGASPVYESLLGIAEITGGVLLLLPRTALAGVLLSLVSMAQVWVLNMTYDVPVKLLSFHLLLMGLVLLAPDARRLTAVLLGGAAGPSTAPEAVRTWRGRRIVAAVQVVLLVWFSAGFAMATWEGWTEWGSGRAKSELYGIWEVTEFTRDGQPVAPLLTDESRWRRLIFEDPGTAVYQRMNDDMVMVGADIDSGAHRITLSPPESESPLATFSYERSTPDAMTLTGELEGRPVTITLHAVDLDAFPVRQNGLDLVQDYPRTGAGVR
ncbi:DoxX family protein [Nocardia crassostreae]|uniref:DoxX family protein n=1 Tax=Nocardia crassostreae TaxID=53428 RepID=UPI00083287FD|nr:DoxX family protein [Nocardia crassostreae]